MLEPRMPMGLEEARIHHLHSRTLFCGTCYDHDILGFFLLRSETRGMGVREDRLNYSF